LDAFSHASLQRFALKSKDQTNFKPRRKMKDMINQKEVPHRYATKYPVDEATKFVLSASGALLQL